MFFKTKDETLANVEEDFRMLGKDHLGGATSAERAYRKRTKSKGFDWSLVVGGIFFIVVVVLIVKVLIPASKVGEVTELNTSGSVEYKIKDSKLSLGGNKYIPQEEDSIAEHYDPVEIVSSTPAESLSSDAKSGTVSGDSGVEGGSGIRAEVSSGTTSVFIPKE